MENVEIILSNVKKEYLDLIIKQEFKLTSDKVISSHFFDKVNKKDIEYTDALNLSDYYSTPNTGNIFVKEVSVGDRLINVMIIMSFDEEFGDIVLNFEEEQFICSSEDELKQKLRKIINKLTEVFERYEVEEIRLGFEPATDDDMSLLIIDKKGISVISDFDCKLTNSIRSL
ncbi:hypothetical protein QUF88_13325 [Bacillus sp. DX1.1]|uniref:hypothetical protein n=1 Tax=unclassified Bacillus (in: firmicutes) TaxID=185979 RepID=UPI00257123E9|nr:MULTISPECIES: hypothetical protein [unclassified Bacillus (in: firmicutes)]MDM5154766.1 hypothetical protein [Bacillus sp. DX1.1]WJE83646.1 hypothetical protein QRE67_10820 [Bacillus sp. DX3.1]